MGWYWGVWVPGVFKLGHLQQAEPLLFWHISTYFTFIPFASLWATFVLKNFQLFHFHTGEANSYYPRGPIMGKGNSSNFKTEWHRGFPVPGAFKLDHLQPIKSLLFPHFYNFLTSILGGQFLLPQRANNGKREFFQLQNWMRQRVSSAWDIQTVPFAAH